MNPILLNPNSDGGSKGAPASVARGTPEHEVEIRVVTGAPCTAAAELPISVFSLLPVPAGVVCRTFPRVFV